MSSCCDSGVSTPWDETQYRLKGERPRDDDESFEQNPMHCSEIRGQNTLQDVNTTEQTKKCDGVFVETVRGGPPDAYSTHQANRISIKGAGNLLKVQHNALFRDLRHGHIVHLRHVASNNLYVGNCLNRSAVRSTLLLWNNFDTCSLMLSTATCSSGNFLGGLLLGHRL